MAISFKQLEKLFREALGRDRDYHVEAEDRTIATSLPMKSYRDPEGDPTIVVAARLSDDGEYVGFFTPEIYNLRGSQHAGAAMRVMLGACWRTGAVQFEVDEQDGEVRATAEYILADGTLTVQQVRKTCVQLLGVTDVFHECICRALGTGEVGFPNEPDFESILPEAPRVPGAVPMDVNTEDVLRAMLKKAREAGTERWKATKPSEELIRRW